MVGHMFVLFLVVLFGVHGFERLRVLVFILVFTFFSFVVLLR